ncbi:MAG: RagB/SusD family nutrient uptake outer membrane protein [Mediterranea sp.]|nr:RagB/SusD family nutrient uptake outer membrane protein [Mediterranea sp.]
MKKYFYITILSATVLLTGCLEEKFPTSMVSNEQITGERAIESLASGIYSYLTVYNAYDNGSQDWGYPARMLTHHVMGPDMPAYQTGYEYFRYPYGSLDYLGNTGYQACDWTYYYKQIFASNLVINRVDLTDMESISADVKPIIGQALVMRAWMYFDMAVTYEFKLTGIADIDAEAQADGIIGLTVPITDGQGEESEAFNNPRAPFYEMYRFILTDLNKAEQLLTGYTRSSKGRPDLSVVYGMQARLWLELASRFRLDESDLATMVSHENDEALARYDRLGVTTAQACYAKAADYARKAIDYGGYQPISQSEWFTTTGSGFNSATGQNSWMMAVIITQDAVPYYPYYSWPGCNSSETTFGVAGVQYKGFRLIGKSLYDQIPVTDWRKNTWVDPADIVNGKGKAPGTKYTTCLTDAQFAEVPAYAGLKFKPGQGDVANSTVGNAVDIPMMRIEEMYFIEAEARGRSESVETGKTLLTNFMNTYRYTDGSYACTATTADALDEAVLLQKRIEFWGEGVGVLDFKRLKLQVVRGYTDTNFLPICRYNSVEGYAPAWMNKYIPENESNRNTDVISNPDASGRLTQYLWSE